MNQTPYVLHAPQVIALIVLAFQVGYHACKHGSEHPPYNGPIKFFEACLTLFVLYWGGFFGGIYQ